MPCTYMLVILLFYLPIDFTVKTLDTVVIMLRSANALFVVDVPLQFYVFLTMADCFVPVVFMHILCYVFLLCVLTAGLPRHFSRHFRI